MIITQVITHGLFYGTALKGAIMKGRILCFVLILACAFQPVASQEKRLTTAQWLEDLEFVVSKLASNHPHLFYKTDKTQFDSIVAESRREIAQSKSDLECYFALRKIVAIIEDGHTGLSDDGLFHLLDLRFPFRVSEFTDGVYITTIKKEQQKFLGSRLRAINGRPVENVLAAIEKVVSGDNKFGRRYWALNGISFARVLSGLKVIDNPDHMDLELVLGTGEPAKLTLSSLYEDSPVEYGWSFPLNVGPTKGEYVSPLATPGERGSLHFKNQGQGIRFYWFEHLVKERTIYFQFNQVMNQPNHEESFAQFSARMWDYIDQNAQNISKFIIDLRYNNGGNGTLILSFLNQIIRREFINKEGGLYVISGKKTYSAASIFMYELAVHTKALFVGEPDACGADLFSNSRPAGNLPNSGFPLWIASQHYTNRWPFSNPEYFVPHFPAAFSSHDYFNGVDPAVDLILSGDLRSVAEFAAEEGADAAVAYYKKLKNKYKEYDWWTVLDPGILEDSNNDKGYVLMQNGDLERAYRVFLLNTMLFPTSFNVWDSLGECCYTMKKPDLSLLYYKKSLELNPDNENAKQMMERIKKEQTGIRSPVYEEPAQSQEIFDLLRKGDIPAVKALIEKSPQLIEARDGDGNTPLHYAAYGQDAGLVNYLIDKGAKIDLAGAQAKTPLHIAASNDRREIVGVLLKRGAALETRDDYQRTALILCARERGQAATGRVLIDAGADVNAADKFGSTALELAAWRGKAEFIDLLLENGARLPESGQSWGGLLSQAADNGLTKLFRRLTEGGQDLKTVDPSGMRLLHAAAAGGSAEIVGLLLDKGFDAGKPDRFGWTPLHYAARDGRTDAARILIEKSAPLNARTIMGQTAYNVAQERGMQAVATLLAEKGADRSDIRFPVLEGDYLGQKPPEDKAELFGLGIVSSIWGLHSTAVFTPDGNEVYWAPMMTFPGEIYSRGGLLMMKRVNGRWTAPSWASFSGPNGEDDVPFFSADGKKIYFISRRPLPGEKEKGSEKIWCADRTSSGWSEPRPLDPNVNSVNKHWEFSLDRKENVYFAGQPPDSRGLQDIYLARFSGGKYEKPVNLDEPINSAAVEDTPFIAPDGSYLVFERQFDLWVSFRGPDGAWSSPVNLGAEVNSPSIELCPMVTSDGKYLFFLSQRDGESHAYWVRADVIEKIRQAEKK